MAKKQTRRSISVSRTTYERLKAFCETNSMSMSQLVETRVNDFLGASGTSIGDSAPTTSMPVRPMAPMAPRAAAPMHSMAPSMATSRPVEPRPVAPAASPMASTSPAAGAPTAPAQPATGQPPMTSAAARFAVEPPLPIIKPRQDTAAPKPAEKRPEQIFTF